MVETEFRKSNHGKYSEGMYQQNQILYLWSHFLNYLGTLKRPTEKADVFTLPDIGSRVAQLYDAIRVTAVGILVVAQ